MLAPYFPYTQAQKSASFASLMSSYWAAPNKGCIRRSMWNDNQSFNNKSIKLGSTNLLLLAPIGEERRLHELLPTNGVPGPGFPHRKERFRPGGGVLFSSPVCWRCRCGIWERDHLYPPRVALPFFFEPQPISNWLAGLEFHAVELYRNSELILRIKYRNRGIICGPRVVPVWLQCYEKGYFEIRRKHYS